jgi:hypothetical protein
MPSLPPLLNLTWLSCRKIFSDRRATKHKPPRGIFLLRGTLALCFLKYKSQYLWDLIVI